MLFGYHLFYSMIVWILEKYSNADWGAVTALASAVAAIFAGYAAYTASKTVRIMKTQQDNMIAPKLGLVGGYTMEKEYRNNLGLYPCFLVLENLGLGPATLFVLDLNPPDLRSDISTPISVAPRARTQILIWLDKPEADFKIKLGVYYWDLNNKCCGTQWSMLIKYHAPVEKELTGVLDWRLSCERLTEYIKERPSSINHWTPNRELFDPNLLALETFKDSPNLFFPCN